MRYCPQCRKVYDDSLSFCLADGTPLLTGSASDEETVVTSPSVVTHDQKFAQPGVNPIFAYLSIGLIALFVGGGLVLWLKSGETASGPADNKSPASSTPSNEQPKSALNSQSNIQRREQEEAERERQRRADERRASDAQKNTSSPPAQGLPRPSNGTWFVVLGSYPKYESGKADQRLRYIQGLGYDATVVDSDNYPGFSDGWYCVVVGPYSKSDARRLLDRIKPSVFDAYMKSGW